MKVSRRYSAKAGKGAWYLANVTCTDLISGTMQQWFLVVSLVKSDGSSQTVFNESYDSLYHAESAMKKWKKGLKWEAMKCAKL